MLVPPTECWCLGTEKWGTGVSLQPVGGDSPVPSPSPAATCPGSSVWGTSVWLHRSSAPCFSLVLAGPHDCFFFSREDPWLCVVALTKTF